MIERRDRVRELGEGVETHLAVVEPRIVRVPDADDVVGLQPLRAAVHRVSEREDHEVTP